MKIEFTGDLKRVTRKPDDVFVVTCEQKLSADQSYIIKHRLQEQLMAPVIVLSDGFKLGVMGPLITVDVLKGALARFGFFNESALELVAKEINKRLEE